MVTRFIRLSFFLVLWFTMRPLLAMSRNKATHCKLDELSTVDCKQCTKCFNHSACFVIHLVLIY